ncbi:universal stress protein [uncultured Muriicola sp.]|uniref:universal stress protein n=1 Tax=uncultured Muriicola sp. TaxID=1583102 RepID=UPI00263A2826|nr:universal stress protein [uncultured Muriicola sp.]
MKTLLYATDFSDNSIAALKFAEMLRHPFNAKLYMLHVFDMKPTFMSTVSISYSRLEEAALKEATYKLTQFCTKHLGKDPEALGISLVVSEHGISSIGILENAEKINADLVIIGTKGSTLLKDLFIGSTASTLINNSYVPLIMVPKMKQVKQLTKIVYATAYEEADILAIRRLVALAEPFKAMIKLVHISTKSEYAGEDQMAWFQEMLRSKVSYPNIEFELRFAEDINTSLQTYIEEEEPMLLAMLEREGHGIMKSIWHKDIVKQMKSVIKIPLLSFHKRNL